MRCRAACWLLLAVSVAFAPALWGEYLYDDRALVLRNPALLDGDLPALLARPFWGQQLGYWRPLPLLVMWLGDRLGGAAGVHALALLLHLIATALAFDLGRRLLADTRLALFAAACFALHPVQVETVAWASAINEGLWGTFALAAVRAADRWRHGGLGLPWGSALCCLLAMLSKETAIVTPLLVAMVLQLGPAGPRPRWRPFAASFAVVLSSWWGLRVVVFGDVSGGLLRTGDAAPLDGLRMVSAPAELLARQLRLLLPPATYTPFREFAPTVDAASAAAWLGLAAALVAVFTSGWRRGGRTLRLALGLLVLPLLPTVLLFRAVGAYPVADRYLYLPAFGGGLLLASLLVHHVGRRPWPWLLPAAMAVLTFLQTFVWRDQQRLVAAGLASSGGQSTLWVMAGDEQLDRAQRGDAAALPLAGSHYQTAERLAAGLSDERVAHRALGAARLGLAWCQLLALQGRSGPVTQSDYATLIAAFQRAVQAGDDNADAWVGLGVANGAAGRGAEAEHALRRAIELDPENGKAWFNLGFLQANQRLVPAARASLQRALQLDPANQGARDLLLRLQ
ncbi:MAG: tetratricopeptide repeat protein [Planctomycetes bacterium]|nr:tetratricopeptide repeat protein [Planctomycetota bacterium]MCC7396050.1 tetratricopeptide repeat protein [Planctomycetota bacterium]